MLFFDTVVVIEDKPQKKFDDQKKEGEALEQRLFFR